jgi:hypothetical protein
MPPNRQQTADAWLQTKCPKLTCPACGKKDWEAKGFIDFPPTPPRIRPVNPPPFSVVAAACQECGFLYFFSAESMGIS